MSKLIIKLPKGIQRLSLGKEEELLLTSSIDELGSEWEEATAPDNLFLQRAYLSAFEKNPVSQTGTIYGIFYRNGQPIGIIYLQTYFVRLSDSFKDKEKKDRGIWDCLSAPIRKFFIKKAVFNLLICGNMLLTGKHGFYLRKPFDENEATLQMLASSVDKIQLLLEQLSQQKIHIQMFKDYPCKEKNPLFDQVMKSAAYYNYVVQPSMHLPLQAHWNQFDDYVEDMQSKYRVRTRRAAKKGEDLCFVSLTKEEIIENREKIYALYQEVARGVTFNAFTLHAFYFCTLKECLGDLFELVAIYLNDEMVGFYTIFYNYGELEAHFLGMNKEVNKGYQLYLNILYEIIKKGISKKVRWIDFARTALEIKSSVGAIACDLDVYARHRNKLSSQVMKFVFEHMSEEEKWQPRSPFKNLAMAEQE